MDKVQAILVQAGIPYDSQQFEALLAQAPRTLLTAAGIVAVAGLSLNWLLARASQSRRLDWVWDDGQDHPRTKINLDDLYFPENFVWGTATAAHQIEGNCTNNNWWLWEKKGKIKHNHSAQIANDHWNRVDEDIDLMKHLGVNAYRFSIEWSKIEPQENQWDTSVIAHYHDEIDKLLAAQITPFVTLYHFTHPIWFDKKGSFEKEENIAHFVRFSKRVFEEFGSKVKFWCTINEPEVITSGGYFTGEMPPGKKDWQLAAVFLKNLCEAHVQVYHGLKALPHGHEVQIGIVKNIFQFEPENDWNPIERIAASVIDNAFNEAILEFFKTGIFKARIFTAYVYHENASAKHSNDFIGLNYYSHYQVRVAPFGKEPFYFVHRSREIMTDMNYPIYPEGIYRALHRIAQVGVPIYVTENGLADADDDRRGLFIRRYLYAVSAAIRDGVDVRGYFYWSLYDNFEWSEGYAMKFGLYSVDFETQKRTLRAGAQFFKNIVARHSKKS